MARKPRQAKSALGSGTPSVDLRTEFLSVISSYEREFQPWEKRVEKIIKRYKDDSRPKGTQGNAHFNILWSNVQTLIPACFSKLPQPDVSRRFKDNDPVGRVASMILERALDFEVQHYPDYKQTMTQSVQDRFLGGRGTAWVRYEPKFKQQAVQEGGVTDDAEEPVEQEVLDYECAPVDYVHWRDFGHDVARTWEEVTKVWRWVFMDEQAVSKRFGEEVAGKIAYDASPNDLDRSVRSSQETARKQAKVCELWDKSTGKAYWFTKASPDFLDERDDPLKLQEFFPCPRPLFATVTNDSLVPVPDFTLYQDQAKELDILADRVDGLAKMLQVKGVYDGSADSSLARLFTEGENGTLMPVKNWAAFAEKGGLAGQVDVMDLKPIYEAFNAAVLGMRAIKEDVYEITGISDIVRGQTQASETATAQQIKGQYASLRLRSMQDGVSGYATELLRLKAQVMCAKFNAQTLAQMAAVDQLSEEDKPHILPALTLLIGEARMQDPAADSPNPMRSFRIEVAADTLVQLDEQAERQDKMELLNTLGAYFEKSMPVAQAAPSLVPLIGELGKFTVRAFKAGKSIEGAFDQAIDQLKAQAANPQPPPPDPEMVKAEMQAKLQAEKQAGDSQLAQQKHADEMSLQREKMAGEQQLERERMAIESERAQRESASEGERQDRQMAMDDSKHQREVESKERIGMKDVEARAKPAVDIKTSVDEKVGASFEKAAGNLEQMNAQQSEVLLQTAQAMKEAMAMIAEATANLAQAAKSMSGARAVVRGPDGKVSHTVPASVQ